MAVGYFVDLGATLVVNHSLITVNQSSNGSDIYNVGTVTVMNNSTVAGSPAASTSGDGIYNSGTLMVTNSTISGYPGSTGATNGGGIFNASGGTVTVTNSMFFNNHAGFGGGIFNASGSTVTVTNSTF